MSYTTERPPAPGAEATKFYLSGNFAPVPDELTVHDLEVRGAIPPELCGRYIHNGPNPPAGDPGHWFFGQGMLHSVELCDGRASWYRNRYVRTPQFLADGNHPPRDLAEFATHNAANTSVIGHGGRILALIENQQPTEVTPTLDTVGPYDFGGKLNTPMTAHPKRCPTTGELHFFGYWPIPPYVHYHVADAAGTLVHSTPIEVPAATFMHDFALTAHSAVFMDLPLLIDFDRPGIPFSWSDDYGARVGVMPRHGDGSQIRWFDIEPCYVFHVLNATEPAPGQVDIDVVRFPHFWRDSVDKFEPTTLHRWSIDTDRGTVVEATLDDRSVEFPVIDPRRVGLPHRFGYAVEYWREGAGLGGSAVVKYDLAAQSTTLHDFGPGRTPDELVFVPAGTDAAEDEGYLVGYVYDRSRDTSEFVILDATDLAQPAVAVVELPRRVPHGFHGSWIPDGEAPN